MQVNTAATLQTAPRLKNGEVVFNVCVLTLPLNPHSIALQTALRTRAKNATYMDNTTPVCHPEQGREHGVFHRSTRQNPCRVELPRMA